ncbi:molybdate ABC transporter ATP-binding protein [Alcanivorax hongdengensis A-11-3]|uniref:Molybdate ABC transporter ATP-binding protein n=1 Tax=Alcanivorax hongdengensis A-11-3 TaxID=1177179 RepID=L0W7T7_9GAMM|nr:molybdenum ABC transporter ATP-binding protein [Alcanivorax hongdengensis]EKF72961.1 molybdate ABC transporter ATP-binding protein [Alcanivorax hongdengensis A-11-3]
MSLQLALTGQVGNLAIRAQGRLPERGVTVLFGRSGAGKSTLLRMIAGLHPCEGAMELGGSVWLGEGRSLPPWQRPLGMMFQKPTLFSHLDVAGNLQYVARRRRVSDEHVQRVIAQTDLAPLRQRRVQTLSGGEAQRVALARALLGKPRLLLLDEPLSALDQTGKQMLLELIARCAADIPVLYVTHDLDELLALADQLWLMEQGAVVSQMPLQQALAQLDGPLVQRQDASAVLSATAGRYDPEHHLQALQLAEHGVWLPALKPLTAGDPVRIRIAARDVSLCLSRVTDSSILNILPVEVVAVRELPPGQVMVQLRLADQLLLARISSRSRQQLGLFPGQSLYAQIKAVALA